MMQRVGKGMKILHLHSFKELTPRSIHSLLVKGSYWTVKRSLHRYLFLRYSKVEIRSTIEAEKVHKVSILGRQWRKTYFFGQKEMDMTRIDRTVVISEPL